VLESIQPREELEWSHARSLQRNNSSPAASSSAAMISHGADGDAPITRDAAVLRDDDGGDIHRGADSTTLRSRSHEVSRLASHA
jgi:hypothetical protein